MVAAGPSNISRCKLLSVAGLSTERRVPQNWTLLSSTNLDFLQGTLLSACRILSVVNKAARREYTELAEYYKLQLLRSLQHAINLGGPTWSRSAINKALVLAFDDVSLPPSLTPCLLFRRSTLI